MLRNITALLTQLPGWIILGTLCVLGPIVGFVTLEGIRSQREYNRKVLLEKGEALIRSLEAGARTGMRGGFHGAFPLQQLVSETALEPDIRYLVVTDGQGKVLADSDLTRVGSTYAAGGEPAAVLSLQAPAWRVVTDPEGTAVFEVYRGFAPVRGVGPRRDMTRRGGHMMGSQRMQDRLGEAKPAAEDVRLIFVGLDMADAQAAMRKDALQAVLLGAALLLIGFGGMVSLLLGQAYRVTRRSLAEVKAFSDQVVQHLPVGVILIDPEGRLAHLNRAAGRILHLKGRAYAGLPSVDVLPPEIGAAVQEASSAGAFSDREVRFAPPGRSALDLEVMATPLQDEHKADLGKVVLLRDLTEVRRLREEVARGRRLAAVGQLAAGVAHEVRNPLSSIKGFATYFRDRSPSGTEDRETADVMIQEVDRLNRVIGQLLEFARPMALVKQETAADELIAASLRTVRRQAEDKGIRIVVQLDPQLPPLKVDRDRMQQVLLNLYLNALEAMEPGGVLSVQAVRAAAEPWVRIVVGDTGKGIPEKDLEHVFDPYFSSKSGGTGLGLAIVHKIVEGHGGRTEIQSRSGEGTLVTLYLPG